MIDSGVDSLDLDLDQDLVKSVHDVNCVDRLGLESKSLDLDLDLDRSGLHCH